MSSIRRGLCMMILSISTALGASACSAEGPTDDDVTDVNGDEQGDDTARSENVSEESEPICEGMQPGAHCTIKCGDNWIHLYNVTSGSCQAQCDTHCKWNCNGACWSL